jgi:hypothetical protein
MFLNYIKNFITKKIIINSLSNVKLLISEHSIKTVGLLIDESYFFEREALVKDLLKNKIKESDINVLVFRDNIKKNEVFDYPVFSSNDLSWTAIFKKQEVNGFIAQDFDLLINYYDTEKVPLLLASHQSKAKFKVGFSSVDKRINHFMITTNAENHTVFIEELFKYLKILNKIE